MAIMEVLIRAIDNASAVMEDIGQKGSKSANLLEANWKKVGVAGAVAGVAIEAMARKQAPLTESTKRLAASTDMTEQEVRDLATSMTNVTFPMEDVLGLMEQGRQQGLKSADALQKYANFWDMIADATGESSIAMSEAGVSLRAVGIEASNSEDALSAFGFITQETSMEISEFLRLIGRVAPEMGAMNMSIDQVAALLGAMEAKGMTARVAQMELQQAMRSANGDMNLMLKTLGITTEEFDNFSKKVEESSDVIERNAAINAESYTVMQKLQAEGERLAYQYGDLISVVGSFTPLMLSIGPIMKGVAIAQSLATVAMTGFGISTLIALGPILLVIAAIAGLIAAGYLIYKNWDKISAFFSDAWVKMKLAVLKSVDMILAGLSKFMGWIPKLGDKIEEAREKVKKLIDSETVKQEAKKLEKELETLVEKRTETLRAELEKQRDLELGRIAESREDAKKAHDNAIAELRKTYGILKSKEEDLQKTKMDLAKEATENTRTQLDLELSAAQKNYDKKIALIDREYSARMKLIDENLARTLSSYQAQIDAIDKQTEVEERAIKEQERTTRTVELQDAVNRARTSKDLKAAEEALQDYLAQVGRERLLESRSDEKEALRYRMDSARNEASDKKKQLETEAEEKKEHERKLLDATTTRLNDEKAGLDAALEEELKRLEVERIAYEKLETDKLNGTLNRLVTEEVAIKTSYEKQLEEAQLHIRALNEATAELKDRTITITTVHKDVYSSSGGDYTTWTPVVVPFEPIPVKDAGGLIRGPGIFGVGAGVTEIARTPSPSMIIHNLTIHAETPEGGRKAGRAFIDELHRRGLRLEGI